jgi:hypothetical protein
LRQLQLLGTGLEWGRLKCAPSPRPSLGDLESLRFCDQLWAAEDDPSLRPSLGGPNQLRSHNQVWGSRLFCPATSRLQVVQDNFDPETTPNLQPTLDDSNHLQPRDKLRVTRDNSSPPPGVRPYLERETVLCPVNTPQPAGIVNRRASGQRRLCRIRALRFRNQPWVAQDNFVPAGNLSDLGPTTNPRQSKTTPTPQATLDDSKQLCPAGNPVSRRTLGGSRTTTLVPRPTLGGSRTTTLVPRPTLGGSRQL